MQLTYDPTAAKKATNLNINSDLLAKAKALKINLSATLEQRLAELVASRQREIWKKENAQAIQDYNEIIEKEGCFSDLHRGF